MAIDVNRMRLCFVVAAIWNRWSESDQAEFGVEIRAAMETKSESALTWWAEYLEQASGLAYLGDLCRAAEARIRADAARRREEEGLTA